MFKLLSFLHLYLLFYVLAFEFVNVKYTSLYIPVLLFHLSFRHLGFSKIRNFNGLSHVRDQCESPCQISSKSVRRLRIYGDLTVLTMAAVRHLGFWKFNFLTVWSLKRHILHNDATFREDLSIPCCDIFFWKNENFNDLSPGQSASSCQI